MEEDTHVQCRVVIMFIYSLSPPTRTTLHVRVLHHLILCDISFHDKVIDGENIKFASVQSPHQVSISINAADMVEASDVTIVPFFVVAVAMCCIDKWSCN